MLKYFNRDLKITKQIEEDESFRNKLLEVSTACRLLGIKTRADFYLYALWLKDFEEFKFEDIFYFDRIQNEEYYQTLIDVSHIKTIQSQTKCKIIEFPKRGIYKNKGD